VDEKAAEQRDMMEKLRFPILLSPEAVEALRQLVHGTSSDRSPSIREVHIALTEAGCSAEDRTMVLAVIGLGDDAEVSHAHARRPKTIPPRGDG
jgi:hypothetical protein